MNIAMITITMNGTAFDEIEVTIDLTITVTITL